MILATLENGEIIKTVLTEPVFDYSCNVLCVGAGSAGVYAADSAAREGAKVILCEIGENIGGMYACGNVTGYYYGGIGGSYEEDNEKNNKDTVFLTNRRHWEQRQISLTQRLQESKVKLFCRHSAIGIFLDENRVIGIQAFDGNRTVNIKADITIDATSDGHLIRMTDVKKQYGKPNGGSFVPFSVFAQYTKNETLYSQNIDSGIINHYDSSAFSEGTILAHATASLSPEEGELVNLALHTGIREGLSFEGEDTLDYENVLLGNHPEKILFWAYSDFDRHGSERATECEMFQNWFVISNLSTVVVNIPVPMGSVVPKGMKGLVTAGRCLSCDTYSQSAVRMNRDMFRMGECIGIAAAMASASKIDFLEIDYNEFLTRAKKRGCFNGYPERAFGFDNSYSAYLNKMHALNRTPDKKYENLAPGDFIYEPIEFEIQKNLSLLQTDSPGVAIWSCFVSKNKEPLKDQLYEMMRQAKDTLSRYNCAIALGLLNDKRSLPVLRKMVQERDCFFFKDNRRSNQFRSAIALCLLGRLGTEEDLPMLFEILSAEEMNHPMYHTLEANYLYHCHPDRNFVYFTMFTHACMAIYKIYQRNVLPMARLHDIFVELFKKGGVLRYATDPILGESARDELNDFIRYILNLTKDGI